MGKRRARKGGRSEMRVGDSHPSRLLVPSKCNKNTRMNVSVFLHIRFLMESLSAEWARVGPSVGVDEEMRRERRGTFEGFPTLSTGKRLLDTVHSPAGQSESST